MKPKCTLLALLLLSAVAATGCNKPDARRGEPSVLPSGVGGYDAAPTQQSKNECCVDHREELADIHLHRKTMEEQEQARIRDEKLFKPIGRFERIATSRQPGADFVLLRDGERWRVEMIVGAEPAGMPTMADCRMILVGQMRGGRLMVKLVRDVFEAERPLRYSEDLEIKIGKNHATIVEDKSSGYCGGPYNAEGIYKKSKTIGTRWALED